MLAHDLIKLARSLGVSLQQGALKKFKPCLELVGSMCEETRLNIANELDLSLKFKAWEDSIPFMVKGDPFSLKKADTSPKFMDTFFKYDKFQCHKFKRFLLNAVAKAIREIFDQDMNRSLIKEVVTNKDWREGNTPCEGECKTMLETRDFVQCAFCAVTVSQTKIGVALQFQWGMGMTYASIDLIPVFPIVSISAMHLARLVNLAMLGPERPYGWLRYLRNYVKHYKIIHDLVQSEGSFLTSVILKTINFQVDKNHHIRPAQPNTEEKFRTERMKNMYCYVKFLKKALGLDLSSFWVKKELLKDQYQWILDSTHDSDRALVQILSQPEFRSKVEARIDFQKSNETGEVHIRKVESESDEM